jgi:hypothetical protein
VATASAAVGLLAISVFAPIPNDSPGAPLLGAVLGVAVALGAARTADPSSRAPAHDDVRAKVAVT